MRGQPTPIRPVGGVKPSAAEGAWKTWLAFALAMSGAAAILFYFHDRFWWPPDDGAYAHVAERILAGEVLNRDVQDVHAGYVNFANAAAFAVFGLDLASLRYPLAFLTLLQSALLFALFVPLGAIRAAVAALAMASLSFVQFLNPTAHWYSLFLFVAILAALSWLRPGALLRLELVGFLLVALLLFRQLTGLLVAIGVLAWLFAERGGEPRSVGRPVVARSMIAVMTLGLCAYLGLKSDLLAFVLFGIWPLGLLVWAWRKTELRDVAALRMLGRLALGGTVAFLPLLTYHLRHGSLASWFRDVVLAASGLTELGFFDRPSYAYFLAGGLRQLLAFDSPGLALNGAYWLVLPLLAAFQGAAMWFALWRAGGRFHPLPFLAVFYALVSAHYQIAIYLYYGAAVSLAGLLWLAGSARPAWRVASLLLAALLSTIGLYWHAGQPLTRGAEGILRGERVALVRSSLERASLWIAPQDETFYARAGDLIRENLGPTDTLLAIPFDPELNFLFARESPVRFYNVALGVRDRPELDAVLAKLASEPPRLVFYKPDDKYNTASSQEIAGWVRQRYELLEKLDGFEIYRLRPPSE